MARVQKLLSTMTRSLRGRDPLRGSRREIAFCAAVVPLLLALAFVSPAIAESAPHLEVRGMTFVASRENNDAVILRAKHARFDTETKMAYLSTVVASIPATSEQRGFQMRCDSGVVDLASNDFEATGNVTGEADSGEHFEVEWVRYDHQKGLLYTEAPVLITRSGTTLRGGGFKYDIATRHFQLIGGAQLIQEVVRDEKEDDEEDEGRVR